MRIPKHIGIIPDGNRRWAENQGYGKQDGYQYGLTPGVEILRLAREVGVEEITYYGFTTDNCKRPKKQFDAFVQACVDAVEIIKDEGNVALLVAGNCQSEKFPRELLQYTHRTEISSPPGTAEVAHSHCLKVNFLVNYGWEWDLNDIAVISHNRKKILDCLKTKDISMIDLVLRWGGRQRLSGFLPVQSVYADIYTIDEMWPDFLPQQFFDALKWYNKQDITLGG